jgi:LAO/AO transport system kinase
MWALVHDRLQARLAADAGVRKRVAEVERAVADGTTAPTAGAEAIAALLGL